MLNNSMTKLLAALRAAAEITRLRILSVLSSGELTVSELMQILGQSQPRVSRHLKLLCDSGLLQRSQEGAWVFHRITDSGEMADVAKGVLSMLDINDHELTQDQHRLQQIKQINIARALEYFGKNAAEWDNIRKLAVPDTCIEKKLIDCLNINRPELFLDLGTGTGRILEIFSPYIKRGIGIDLSREMLLVARSNLDSAGATNCSVRQNDINALNFDDGTVDAITIHQVLHYLDQPERVIKEAARVLKSGGQLIIVDFLPHNLEFLREKHAHRRLGISEQSIAQWADAYQLSLVTCEKLVADNPENGAHENNTQLNVGLWNLMKSCER
ncbi:ArsR/SmtB family transcription factor [Candidatus Spongiihabitans sp.]|uniref:ArsR/SmtB family transcription factor n=1 Tax=Candidatus Spongiihabitans sp. TaxID=3101308 RepID=UPI003C7CA071